MVRKPALVRYPRPTVDCHRLPIWKQCMLYLEAPVMLPNVPQPPQSRRFRTPPTVSGGNGHVWEPQCEPFASATPTHEATLHSDAPRRSLAERPA